MNFKGHLIGGAATGALAAAVVIASGHVSVNADALSKFLDNPWSPQNDIFTLMAVFTVALFMSLFPDMDIGSIPQRWFLRASFVALAVLFFYKKMDWFAALTFITLLPMLHKHRGWTHFKSAPFIIFFTAALACQYYDDPSLGLSDFSPRRTAAFFINNWPYALACVSGHHTHLLLDFLGKRRLQK